MSSLIDIISCIAYRFVSFTATEKRIIQFILDDAQAAATLPIAEMERLTQTSQASITRFSRTVGCDNVRELKMKLAQSLAVGQRFILCRIWKGYRAFMRPSLTCSISTGAR